ncbi:hypothetical protein AUJ65_05450 [Candidatus Micrarchaeota archaeon CG1_02_51_15]|nr:MAG: hypothetical protein AUJ65_05450 [Candidatus Micrarchaeota archaeon CG1_02_51_15]
MVLPGFAAFLFLATGLNGKFTRCYAVLALVFVLFAVYDLWFAHANFLGIYSNEGRHELIYLLSYFVVICAITLRALSLNAVLDSQTELKR